MTHPYLALTDADRDEMLRTIGVASVEELFRDVPAGVRLAGQLDLEPALTEHELSAHLAALAARNVDTTRELSFLGAGVYDHHVPAVVDAVRRSTISRPRARASSALSRRPEGESNEESEISVRNIDRHATNV